MFDIKVGKADAESILMLARRVSVLLWSPLTAPSRKGSSLFLFFVLLFDIAYWLKIAEKKLLNIGNIHREPGRNTCLCLPPVKQFTLNGAP